MKFSKVRKGVFFAIAAGTLGLGCELIVDFDRTKIPVEGAGDSGGTADSSVDASFDATVPDTSTAVDAADAADTSVVDAADAADDAPDGD